MLKHYLISFLISMVPLIELRGALPYALANGIPTLPAYIVCLVGNMLPVPVIFFFARKVLESADKPVLWHCTVGKDRAGFATAIVLEMLGADRETVMADYLATNGFIEHDLEAIANFYFGDAGSMESRAEDAFRRLFGASREFLEAAFSKAEEMYGSFRGYIRDGLHISDEEIEAWRDAMLSVPEESL